MVVQFAFLHIILILWPIYPLASAQYNIIAQTGCNSSCGGVEIPYPFGMTDQNCYADKWFEIECRNDTPFLKSTDILEVKDIDVNEGTVTIMNPIYRRNCQRKDATQGIDMRGSPFVYSQEMNKFVGVGCNNLALLVSNGSEVGGCVSICDKEESLSNTYLEIDGCLGRSCCETSLPVYLSEYNATFEDIGRNTGATDECRYALIVRDYYLDGKNLGAYLKDLDYVPARLEWEILNSTIQLPHTKCHDTNITSSEKNHSGRRCDCGPGFRGNPYVSGGCTAISGYFNEKNRATEIIGGVFLSLGSIVFLIGISLLYKIFRKRRIQKRQDKHFKQNGGLLLQQRLSSGEINFDKTKLFSLKDLEKATDNFNVNRVLGKGGQGTVYKGMLVDGKIVAVKKYKVQGHVDEFINEVVILSQVNHRHVVKLLGFCLETKVPLLVYEFIPNGNLFQYLHDQNEENIPMTWEMRLRIAIEVAGALFYLHSAASQPIYHRDIKSTNILLDEKYRAKVADFGTSRMVTIEDTHLTTLVQGTFGYLDPEYFHTSQFTEKSDVYSFGVVLIELLTGQKPISSIRPEEAKSLASYFIITMEEDRVFEVLDRRIMEGGEKEEIMAVANLARRCLELNGRKRPTMKEVTIELEGIQKCGKRSDIAEQSHEKIEVFGIEANQHWATNSTSIESTLNSRTSLSSAVNEEVQSK